MKRGTGTLGRGQATALAISLAVGIGVLILPTLAAEMAGPLGSFAAWIVMTILALPLIAVFARLGRDEFRSGGIAAYSSEALGEWSVLGVQFCLVSALVLAMPAMVWVATKMIVGLLGLPLAMMPVLSHGLLAILCLNQFRPIRDSTRISIYSAGLIVFLVLGVLVVGFAGGKTAPPVDSNLEFSFLSPSFRQAAVLIFFGYIGWESLSLSLRDLRDPERDAGFVYWASFIFVSVIYLALAACVSRAMRGGLTFTGEAGILALIPAGGLLTAAQVIAATILLANLNAWVLSGVRQMASLGASLHGRDRPTLGILTYFGVTSTVLVVLETGHASVSGLVSACNQNWIVLYGAVLLFFFRRFTTRRDRALGFAALIAFGLLVTAGSAMIVVSLGFFALSYLRSRSVRVPITVT